MKIDRLAIISPQPIQCYSPWFQYIQKETNIDLKVFYLNDIYVKPVFDHGFQRMVQWDVPLLEDYEFEFINEGINQLNFWQSYNKLKKTILEYAPQSVLLIGYNNPILYKFMLAWDHKHVPLILKGASHRLLVRKCFKEFLKRIFISLVFRKFTAFLYQGKANYEYYRYHQVPPERLFFSPHAVDNQRFFTQEAKTTQDAFEWKIQLGIPAEDKVILFAGKFVDVKRPLDLIAAFLEADLKDVVLLFVGSGPLESQMKQAAEHHKNIYFGSFQNQSFMPRTYAVCDLFVLPSQSETWGLAINEAMCMSKPVIASSHVGCAQDLVHHGKNGLVFPSGDLKALTASLKEAFLNKDRLEQWGKESRKIIEKYDYRQATDGLINALKFLKAAS